MKKYIGICCLLAIAFIAGCIDDRGNYDYVSSSEVFPVKITGLDTTYNCLVGDVLRATPTVTGVEGENNLKYTWFVYERHAYGKEDTVGHTKDLEWLVDVEVDSYYLMFEVRDTVRDLFVKKTVDLSVRTAYSTGWYVLEDDGTNTDVDMVANGRTTENLMTTFGSGRMEGKAVKMVYKDRHPQEVESVDGKVSKEYKKAFSVISERDMRVYDAQNMSVLKFREDCFYEMPVNLRPLNVATETLSDEINVDGKFYLMSTGNVGKFGYPVMGADGTENYSIFREGVLYSQYCYLWDEVSKSFVYAYTNNSKFTLLNEAGDGEANYGTVSNTGCEMKRFQFRSYKYQDRKGRWMAYALWLNRERKYEILDLMFVATNYPIVGKYDLPAGSELPEAEEIEVHKTETKLFFSRGNRLYEHLVNAKTDLASRERVVYTFPAGEEISCIRHLVAEKSVNEPMNRLVVLTNGANGWKLYGFEFINGGGEFDMTVTPEKAMIGQGEGNARYVMRMDNNKTF
ncbi:PKD-like family lipoprotein [Butyricimonas paravirosa]